MEGEIRVVKVYALSTCPWCKKLKKFLEENEIAFSAVDVDLLKGDSREKALSEVDEAAGRRSFPITVIGDTVVMGFKPEEIKEALASEE